MQATTYLHYLYHALRLRWDPSHRAPLTMNLQLTYRCPNRCAYCAYDADAPDALAPETLPGIFREAWALGGRRVGLTGGEPLLLDYLADAIRAAKRIGFVVTVSTSGVGAEGQLEALGLCDRVMLSFDGPPEVRAELCGGRAADEADRAVALMAKNRIPFWTTTVLNRSNIGHIDWIVDHARRHGSLANFVLLQTQPAGTGLRFHPTVDAVRDLMPPEDELRDALRRLVALKRAGAPIGSSLPFLETLAEWPDYRRICSSETSPLYRCVAGRASCELTADGLLYPCSWVRDRTAGVSVLEHGFASAFRRLPPIVDCNSCVSSCWLESNLIFNLNPRTVLNWAGNLLRR